ncbi:hypothetical protein MSAN_00417800 [Mycena sanguinolenta]|uniref:Uncharacterized protein n=1 Tax=Mycena sanguinolenta TaxID=230812 RepID=A0A8H7DI94_9AGAR|nr:hypothetical protein MSAN_00417800 [Mycena sanguinolenta]
MTSVNVPDSTIHTPPCSSTPSSSTPLANVHRARQLTRSHLGEFESTASSPLFSPTQYATRISPTSGPAVSAPRSANTSIPVSSVHASSMLYPFFKSFASASGPSTSSSISLPLLSKPPPEFSCSGGATLLNPHLSIQKGKFSKRSKDQKETSAAIGLNSPNVLETLSRIATESVASIPHGRVYPLPAVQDVLTKVGAVEDLVKMGRSYLHYGVVVVLHTILPKRILSRGSLTVIRGELLAKASTRELVARFCVPGNFKALPTDTLFYAMIGALASRSVEELKAFVLELFSSVFTRLVEETINFPSIRGKWSGDSSMDRTRTILVSIRAREESSSLKCRRSFDKENVLAVPTSPPREVKRESFHNGHSLPASVPCVRSEPGTAEALEAVVYGTNPMEDFGLSQVETAGNPRANQEVIDAVKLAIISETLSPTFRPAFPQLLPQSWDLILGKIEDRDPLETVGDAAMYVVVTELLVTQLRGEEKGGAIYNAIHAQLLSNATFLHFLLASSHFHGSDQHKFPGNAFELFAAALAAEYLASLKSWIKVAFQPLIDAAIRGWKAYTSTQAQASKAQASGSRTSRKRKIPEAMTADSVVQERQEKRIKGTGAGGKQAKRRTKEMRTQGQGQTPAQAAFSNKALSNVAGVEQGVLSSNMGNRQPAPSGDFTFTVSVSASLARVSGCHPK